MQGAAGLKPVGMGRDAAHGMKAHRTADHFFMPLTAKICPGLIQLKGFFKGHTCKLGRNRADFAS